jgi:lipid-A-disaccharide synthase-like uncharacterized protein
MKWEPAALMVLLLGLGVWSVIGLRDLVDNVKPAEGARVVELRVGNDRGVVEMLPANPRPGESPTFRLQFRNGFTSEWMSAESFRERFGEDVYTSVTQEQAGVVFRALNITSWASLVWVCVGFAGQMAFFGRMMIQWLVSEKQKQSVVPEAFWWLSLFGGVTLFVYFVWRQDIVGVLGQCSGVVIYARNLKLIAKQRRRALAAAETSGPGSPG